MRLQVLRENLVEAVSRASRITSNQPNLPILSNILLRADVDQLVVEASNLETSIRIKVRAKVEKPGKVTLPARKLADYLSTHSDPKLVLEEKNTKLVILTENSRAEFVTLPADDFPQLPQEGKQQFKIPSGKLIELIEKTTFAASHDEVRPVLTGVYLRFTPQEIIGVATDGFRLSEFRTGWEGSSGNLPLSVVVPAKTLQEVGRNLKRDEKDAQEGQVVVALSSDGNQILLSSGEVELISRLLEVEYPDYQKIIPEDFTTQAVFERERLTDKVKLAAIFAYQEGQTVRMFFDSVRGEVVLRSRSSQVGEHESKEIGEIQGVPMEVGFNAGFFLEGLNSLKSQRVRIKLRESEGDRVSPVVVLPEGKESEDSSYLHLIMPVRLE